MRTGRQYIDSLDDGRSVFIDGKRVANVAAHPAFEGIARTVGSLYDYAADPANGMLFHSPHTDGEANKVFMIPRSAAELQERRQAIARWANLTKGWVGRSPDHVGGFMAGFASSPETFDKPDREYGRNVTAFYQKLLEESLYVSYVIIPPQIDRATTAHAWKEELLQVGVLEEREGGFVVRGSQMLGTSTSVSDYLFVSCIKPLAPADERYALSFVLPVNTRGLKIYCRRPYAPGQPSQFDYPLSTRFDETDALIVFDDVFVPWENTFVYRDVEKLRNQFFDTAAHLLGNHQSQVRLIAKMKFIAGVARKIAHVNGIDVIPSVQEKLGEMASLAAIVEGMVIAAEAACTIDKHGVAKPNARFLYGSMGLQAEIYPRAISILRELAGGGVIQLPSSYKDLTNPETRPDFERYLQSPRATYDERIKLFKLAWDMIGSEFAGRHTQYEMFYAGAPFISRGYAYRNYGYDEAVGSVDEFLSSYGLPDA
ncbi:MAG: 4-hydroxyphenylacetate 3-hydroxylase [Acidobacteria bacterium]|nr:4-hydroxyphenylacetate 3-hydroxylase [Acidobacteriota bacterium]